MTLVDTNVIVDLTAKDAEWREWSIDRLTDAAVIGDIFINDVVFAELAARYEDHDTLDRHLAGFGLSTRRIPKPALFLVGQAYARYRRTGGEKLNVLPDFLIGAHAAFMEVPLITRDAKIYRTYFPTIELIAP